MKVYIGPCPPTTALSADEQRTLATLLRRLLLDLEDAAPTEDAPARRLGLDLAPAHTTIAMRRAVGLPECTGLLVRAVDRGGPAARAGIAPGDLVIGVNGRDVRAVADLYDPPPTPGGGPATPRLMRGQEPIDVRIPPDRREGLPG